ncbi:MAG TPA: phospholipase D-like domain-containing protein [Chitinophagaceae bacterium]|nr:phospholipase D-like domain-containing protein [Chitinophagaceae bacterium]
MSAGQPKTNFHDYTANNRVKFVRGGKEYFDLLLQMIGNAKNTIHLQTYIYDDDETGTRVTNALKEAVQRKVQVYLVVDGYASQVMSQKFIDDMKTAGIHFRFFETIFRSKYFYFGRRLHHKLLVTDTRYALVGGLNISDRYNDMPGHPAWLDFALYAEGEIAKQLCVLCCKTWKGFPVGMGITPCEEKELKFEFAPEETSRVRMRRNDWVRRKNQISRSYIEMLKTANSSITILCSYFLPGRVMRRNMILAVNRGVKIKLVLAGLSDVMLAKAAERFIYDWLLRNKIAIYEYQGNVLHGKVAVCDNEWLTIGSYNVNNISAYASIELNLDVYNPSFAAQVEEKLEEIIKDKCVQITEERLAQNTNIIKRFIRWSSYEIIKAGFYLFTFYFRQKS